MSSCCCVAGMSGRFWTLCTHKTTGFSTAASSGVSNEQGSRVNKPSTDAAAANALLLLSLAAAENAAAAAGPAAAVAAPEELAVDLAAFGSAGGSGTVTLNSCSKHTPKQHRLPAKQNLVARTTWLYLCQ